MHGLSSAIRFLPFQGSIAGSLLLAGCVAMKPVAQAPTATANTSSALETHKHTVLPASFVPVLLQGRYTLVELVPDSGQRDLMLQIVDVRIPSTLEATVADALSYVLLRSGYRLCEGGETVLLYALPLPAAHLHLGPLPLREALLTLTGSAWDLSIDDASRTVCFSRHVEPATPALAVAATSTAPRPPSLAQVGKQPSRFDLRRPREIQP